MAPYEKKKLTIRVDSRIIEKAKEYAANRETSLSQLVEMFLDNLITNSDQVEAHTELVHQLSGLIPEELETNRIRDQHIREKYDV